MSQTEPRQSEMCAGALRLLVTIDAVGGVWQCALDLARALHPLGCSTVLALLGPEPAAAQLAAALAVPGAALARTGLPLDWLAEDLATVHAAGASLAAIAEDAQVDLVHLNHPAFAAGKPFGMPVVAAAHSCVATWWKAVQQGPLPGDFAWRSQATRAGLLAADVVVCPSVAFARATQEAYSLRVRPSVVHNGRSVIAPPGTQRLPFARLAFTAGRLWDVGKNIATLDRAAARLDFPLLAAGATRGPHGETAPPYPYLHLLGTKSEAEIGALLAGRPVFVSAAYYEPFGLAVLEAASAGCALVLADIESFRELWDGVAIFVHPCDSAGFATALTALIDDPTEREARGEQARQRAENFTPAAAAAGMAKIYRLISPVAARLPETVAA